MTILIRLANSLTAQQSGILACVDDLFSAGPLEETNKKINPPETSTAE